MPLMKHVVNESGVGRDEEMTPAEEAEFLSALPVSLDDTTPPQPTKAQLLVKIEELLQHVQALA